MSTVTMTFDGRSVDDPEVTLTRSFVRFAGLIPREMMTLIGSTRRAVATDGNGTVEVDALLWSVELVPNEDGNVLAQWESSGPIVRGGRWA